MAFYFKLSKWAFSFSHSDNKDGIFDLLSFYFRKDGTVTRIQNIITDYGEVIAMIERVKCVQRIFMIF